MTTLAELYSALKYRVDVSPITGTRRYYNSANQLHCEEGPAIVRVDGTRMWLLYGRLHRTNGPAIEWSDGSKEWWVHGVNYTERDYYLQLKALGFNT